MITLDFSSDIQLAKVQHRNTEQGMKLNIHRGVGMIDWDSLWMSRSASYLHQYFEIDKTEQGCCSRIMGSPEACRENKISSGKMIISSTPLPEAIDCRAMQQLQILSK